MELRPYQRGSLDGLYDYWRQGGGNGLIVIPTGGGKSLIIATLCQELLRDYPDLRIGIVTHVKELVSQNCQELLRAWPQAPVGIYSAGVGRRDTHSRILFMGIQSVHNKTRIIGKFDVLLIDEAHLIPRNSDTMYGRFIQACLDTVPDMRVIGLTATHYRLDSGLLHKGDGALFHDVVYEANVRELIEQGYLSPLISKATLAQINTEGLHRRAGEFVQSEMDERARIPSVVEAAVNEIVEAGQDRAGWLVFCTGVEHAAQVRDEIRKHGVSCEMVTGDTPAGERDSIIRRYKEGKIRCLTSVGVLTTGFNAPHVDLVALLRPTLSTGLYVQMVGRAFRLAPGKTNALILDFAGNVMRHGPVDAIKPKRGPKGAGEPREPGEEEEDAIKVKVCPACREYVLSGCPICPNCGHEWPAPPPQHEATATADAPILTTEAVKPKHDEVTGTYYFRHSKMGSPDSMRVEYETEARKSHAQWICFEHTGHARNKAVLWWQKMGGSRPIPATVAEAIERAPRELKTVVGVEVRMNGRYPEVISVSFAKTEHRLTPEERAKIVDRMKAMALKTVANGCSAPEADSASAKLSEMARKYGIRASEYGGRKTFMLEDDEIPF